MWRDDAVRSLRYQPDHSSMPSADDGKLVVCVTTLAVAVCRQGCGHISPLNCSYLNGYKDLFPSFMAYCSSVGA